MIPDSIPPMSQPPEETAASQAELSARERGGEESCLVDKAEYVRLKRDAELLSAFLQSVPDSIYFKDLKSRFLMTSSYLARRVGVDEASALEGKTDFDVFSPEHAQPAFEMEQRIIQSQRPVFHVEEKEVFPNGAVSWVSTSKAPLKDAEGRVIGTFGISRDITARKEMERTLADTRAELTSLSQLASMAEIASGVLHNIGNALNSVITSTAVLADQTERSRVANLSKAVQMLKDHEVGLSEFLSQDPKGKQLVGYLVQLGQALTQEREAQRKELQQLKRSVEHIKEIVVMQQNYARVSHCEDDVDAVGLIEEALTISEGSLTRHSVTVVKQFEAVPPVKVVRHKVLQILVNLLRNAKHAMEPIPPPDRRVTLGLRCSSAGMVEFSVRDNGIGISQEHKERLFTFGFTTRKDGHGFGLHSSLAAAHEMKGEILAQSDGPGKGACFVLSLPSVAP